MASFKVKNVVSCVIKYYKFLFFGRVEKSENGERDENRTCVINNKVALHGASYCKMHKMRAVPHDIV